ncbi:hypothetical protein [Micromonospora sp. LOL_015]|uniref:hypothetical protein n=1 Tax=Micromonospora sp. LOL_015 TaxID=3345416 RepID=UPI003A881C7C
MRDLWVRFDRRERTDLTLQELGGEHAEAEPDLQHVGAGEPLGEAGDVLAHQVGLGEEHHILRADA